VIASTTVGVEFERAVGLGRLSDWVRMIAPRLTSLPPPKEPRNRAAIPSQVDVQQSYADKLNREHGEADDFGSNGQVKPCSLTSHGVESAMTLSANPPITHPSAKRRRASSSTST
jgi:hypothetical protein